MTQREKRLGLAVLLLVVGYGGWLLWGRWSDAADERQRDRNTAMIALSEAQLGAAEAQASLGRLEALRERSLPADPEAAQAAYQGWLIEQIAKAGLSFEFVRPVSEPMNRGGAYTLLPFKLQAEGDLESVTKFLHAFYRSSATHKLTQLKLTPTEPKGQVRIDADIEAIIVAGASRKSGMPEAPSGRLALASAEAYVASIGERNVFKAYRPPPAPRPPAPKRVVDTPPPFDDATKAYFTAAVGTADERRAWIVVRTTGERLQVAAGDDLEVGLLKGRVLAVEARGLIIEADDERLRVPLGKSLREGVLVSSTGADSTGADEPSEPNEAGSAASSRAPVRGGKDGRLG